MDRATRKKMVEFLGSLNSHEVYGIEGLAKDFEEEVGMKFPKDKAPSMTAAEFRKALKAEGRGGWYSGSDSKARLVSGCTLVEFFADEYGRKATDREASLMGRGFRFRAALGRLRTIEAGESHSCYIASWGLTCDPGCELCRAEALEKA